MEEERSLRDYVHILLARKWWVIGTFLTIVFLVGLYTFIRPSIYRSQATIQITNDNPGAQVGSNFPMMSWFESQNFQQTQYQILASRSLALRVIKALNLDEQPEFALLKENAEGKSETEIKDEMAQLFLAKLTIQPVEETFLVNIAYDSKDKQLSKKVIDTLADEYMYLIIDRRNESYKLVRNWLNKKLEEWANKVQEAQKKLYKFGQETDIYAVDENISVSSKTAISSGQTGNVVYQKFIDLSALLTKAQSEKMAKQALYQQIKEKGPDAPLVVNDPLIVALRQEMVTQQAKVSAMGKIYLKGHPEMQAEVAKLAELRSRLNGEVKRLQESAKADFEAANRTEKLLQESLVAQKQEMAKLQENLSNYQILKRDALTNEQLYQALLARVKEANISSTMVAANASVIDPGTMSSIPYKPKTVRDMALAVILGLVFGVGLAFLVESLDDTIKYPEDLEKNCHLPLIGILPSLNSKRRLTRNLEGKQGVTLKKLLPGFLSRQQNNLEDGNSDMVVLQSPSDPLTEAIRQMETSVMLSVSGRPPGAIMVTSPNPSEGKSMVANNLALGFALNGRSTVIMDCDLRKPRIHKIYGLDPQPGLSNYLTGTASLEGIKRETKTTISNLTVIPSGPISPSPGSLLNSQLFKDLLAELRQQYDHIIIDTPPILGFSDARIISVWVDGTLLVCKFHSTNKGVARFAVQLLNQINAPIIGGIINAVKASGKRYGHYHYHSYKFYSKYHNQDKT
jgi:capsular exopolysaccharide synthesis family protein